MRFNGYKECRDAVKLWAILNGYNIKWMKSGGHKLQARCEDNCSWRLYTSTLTKEPSFMIKTFHEKHTCVRATRNIQANSQWVVDLFMPKLKSTPNYRAIDIKNDCRLTYGFIVTKSLCYRAKKAAEDQYRGTYEEHYSKVRPYVADLMKMDKEGRFQLKTYLDNEDRPAFQRLYIGFSCLRKGFLVGCRRAIGFGACFLKTVLGGALLAAVAKDYNMKMYPIAWAVVEKETEETWSWFFEILFEDLNIGDGFGWTFMSDKQKRGLISGIQKLAPNVKHRHCARHIYANWKKQFGGPKYKALFWDMVKSTSQTQYQYKLNQLKVESVAAYEDFCNRGPQTSCKSLISPFTKCDMIENNICESFNSYILKSRDKPLIEMLEDIRMSFMIRMLKIAKRLTAYDDILCPNIRKKLDKLLNSVRLCEIVPAIGEEFEVHYSDEIYIVDLMKNECSCNEWALTGLPCCHAMACILDARENLEKYVDDFFFKSTCVATYRHDLRPRHGPREWSSINEAHILPPQYTRRPGRQKKSKKRPT